MSKKFPWKPKLKWYEGKSDGSWEGYSIHVGFFYIDVNRNTGDSKWEVWFTPIDGSISMSYKPFKRKFKDLNRAKNEALIKAYEEIGKVFSSVGNASTIYALENLVKTVKNLDKVSKRGNRKNAK